MAFLAATVAVGLSAVILFFGMRFAPAVETPEPAHASGHTL